MTGIYLVTVTLIAVFINVVVTQLPPIRLDLTVNSQYSLAEATKDVLRRLEDRIKIEAYFTKDLPAPYNQSAAYVRDLLDEYAAYAGGNLAYEFIDPGPDESKWRELILKGIQPVQIQEIRNDQIGIRQAFMGIVITYGTRSESIPLVRQTSDLEFELTGIVKQLTSQQLKVIAFSTGHGEPELEEKMQRFRSALQKNYEVIIHDFKQKKALPGNVTALVIVSPKEKWDEEEIFYLDQFLMRGGSVAFLLDGVKVDMGQPSAAIPVDHGLFDLLASYGVRPEKNLIADSQCKRVAIETRQGNLRVRNVISYPYFPSLTNLNRDEIITRDIGSLTFPFMSSLTIAGDLSNRNVVVLASTSGKSWAEKGTVDINPMQRFSRSQGSASGPFVGAALVSGKFQSFFSDKASENSTEYLKDPSKVLKESQDTRILVLGSGYVALDDVADEDNLVFLVNAIDWLVQDAEMIKIRNRGLIDRPIVELSPFARNLLRYVNVVGVPFVFVLFGILRWQWRKARLRHFRL